MRTMQKKYPGLKQPSEQCTCILQTKKIWENMSIQDTRHSNEGRPRSVRKPAAIHEARKLIEDVVLSDVSNGVT